MEFYLPPGEDAEILSYSDTFLQRELIDKLDPTIVVAQYVRFPNFYILVGLAIGGEALSHGLHAFQITQRFPLRYQEDADEQIRKILEKIDWKEQCDIDPKGEGVGVFINIETNASQTKADVIESTLEAAVLNICDTLKEMKLKRPSRLQAYMEANRRFDPRSIRKVGLSKPFLPPPGSCGVFSGEDVTETAKAYGHARETGMQAVQKPYNIDHIPIDEVAEYVDAHKGGALGRNFADKVRVV